MIWQHAYVYKDLVIGSNSKSDIVYYAFNNTIILIVEGQLDPLPLTSPRPS